MTVPENVILKERVTEGSCLGRHGNRPLQLRCNKIDSSLSLKMTVPAMPGGQGRPPLRLPTFQLSNYPLTNQLTNSSNFPLYIQRAVLSISLILCRPVITIVCANSVPVLSVYIAIPLSPPPYAAMQ